MGYIPKREFEEARSNPELSSGVSITLTTTRGSHICSHQ